MQAVTHVDVTAAEVLVVLHDELQGSGIDVRFARANGPLREQLTRWLEATRSRTSASFLRARGRRRLPRVDKRASRAADRGPGEYPLRRL